MNRKAKYAAKKGASGERMAINLRLVKRVIGFALILYGFLVAATPLQYATWIPSDHIFLAGPASFILMLIGAILLLRR